jgi:Holliday junction DNA helicase RuvA
LKERFFAGKIKTMISFLSGKVLIKKESFIILEKNGIGFRVFLSKSCLEKIKEGDKINLFCCLCVRNEKPELYGFLTFEQLEVFEILEKISGIGPKAALIIASLGNFEDLKKAVETQDFKYFQNIKGVGKKKIQKIILEIGGQIKKIGEFSIPRKDEALKALVSLGFSSEEAKEALEQVPKEITDIDKRIKKALQILGGRT